jgi:hypothetical protein
MRRAVFPGRDVPQDRTRVRSGHGAGAGRQRGWRRSRGGVGRGSGVRRRVRVAWTAPGGGAHSDVRGAAGRLSGGTGFSGPYHRALRPAFEMTHRGARGNGLLTGRGVVSRESESSGGRVSGPERNRPGSCRTPSDLCRTGEVGGVPRGVENPAETGGKRRAPGGVSSRRSLSTRWSSGLVARSLSSPSETLFELARRESRASFLPPTVAGAWDFKGLVRGGCGRELLTGGSFESVSVSETNTPRTRARSDSVNRRVGLSEVKN